MDGEYYDNALDLFGTNVYRSSQPVYGVNTPYALQCAGFTPKPKRRSRTGPHLKVGNGITLTVPAEVK